jgi:hypothetical protein
MAASWRFEVDARGVGDGADALAVVGDVRHDLLVASPRSAGLRLRRPGPRPERFERPRRTVPGTLPTAVRTP